MFQLLFIPSFLAAAITQARAQIELEMQEDKQAKDTMTPEAYEKYAAVKAESRKEHEKFLVEERRHKEKCDAIRSTSFWRF